jgi:glycosyltransferase involved in cell wall biosynthesis
LTRLQTEKNRLVFLINDAPSFVSRRLGVLKAAIHEGFEVHVVAPSSGVPPGESDRVFYDAHPREAVEQILAAGAVHHELPMTRAGMHPIGELRAFLVVLSLYRQIKPQVAHHFALKAILYGTLAAWITRVPRVINSFIGLGFVFLDGSFAVRLIRKAFVRLYAFVAKRTNCMTVFQNPDDAETIRTLAGLPGERMRLIRGSGVDCTRFSYAEERDGTPVVLLASRMLRDKGVIEFGHAAKSLRDRGVLARFIMVGGTDAGNPARLTELEIDALCSECGVEWWGQRYDMPEVLANAHIVCLPSYGEGVPKSLLEASARGRAVIGSDVPGCREAVVDGVNGLLVQLRSAESLAAGIQRLLSSPDERRRMGIAGRKIVQDKFSLERVVEETVDLYRSPGSRPAAAPLELAS